MTQVRRGRAPRSLAAAGLVLAVVAELCSAGLLGLSGWFISACAVAGAAAFSSFSYVAPSGGVRAFALARVAGNYGKRLVLHAAALRRVAAARSDLFDRAAATDPAQPDRLWSGDLLDRSMADAESAGMALIESTAPVAVTAATTAGAVIAVALATSALPAAVLAAGVVITAAIAHRTAGTARETEQSTRKALRTELVGAVDAWAEMASLGAAGELAARTTTRLTRLAAAREAAGRRRLRTALTTGLVGTATLVATLACVLDSAPEPATFVFVALLALGVPVQAGHLAHAAEARVTARAAHRRLTESAPPHAPSDTTVPAIRSWSTAQGIGFADYGLPPTALRPGRVLGATVDRGATLVVTGRSGSGKSTLLRALARSLRQSTEDHDHRPAALVVAADDYLFTGTLGSNWRLADPALTDSEVDTRLAELWLNGTGLTATTPVGPGGRQLSGGELRRVCLGRALARHPHVLIVDEPTTGLDDRTARHVLGILADLPDTTLVLALHDVPAWLERAAHVVELPLDQKEP
ncbi:ATP-binding cassette domain-containing protein [Streptomyces sp. NBC_01604]|uniref:ATP-binding cassette domain-containing protein n=1 Tax=Streptomyces sp. NBC_01604 TaxID=2975894 RepID=UPI003866CA07